MAGNPHSSGGDTRAATTFAPGVADGADPDAEVNAPHGGTPSPGTPGGNGAGKRRPRALTVVAVLAVALFALWGIGGPLIGTSVLGATNEMVTGEPWASAGFAGTEVTNTFLDDTYTSELPSTILFKQQLGSGNVAEWNPYTSGGSPLGALPDFAFFSPLTVPFYVLPTWLAPAYERLLEVICAVGGAFLFLRRLSVSRAAALAGGLVYASSGFMVAWLGFPQTRVAAFIPALFWAVERFVQLRRVRDAALVALPVAALLLGGFPAVTAYALLTAVGYVLVRLISQHKHELRRLVRPVLYLCGSVVAGAGLTLFQLIPFLGFFQTWLIEGRNQSGGSHLQAVSFLTSIAPWAFGSVNPADNTPFVLKPNMVEAVSFVGAAAMVLVLVAFAMPRRGRALLPTGVWVFLTVTTVVWAELVYVGGPPLSVLQHTPVLRAVFEINFIGRARSILGFLLAVLAAVGLELLLRAHARRREAEPGPARRVWPVLVSLAGVLVAGVLVWAGAKDVRAAVLTAGRDLGAAMSVYRGQLVTAGILVAAAVACVLLLRFAGGDDSPARRGVRFGAAAVLILLIAAQSTQFVVRYYPHSPKSTFYPSTDTHQYLADNLGDDRYASSFTGMVFGTNSAYPLRSVNGHTFINAQFAALVRGIPDDPINYPTYIDFAPGDASQATSPVLDLLGTKYYVASPYDPVLGALHPVPVTGSTVLAPNRPVTLGVPTTGPLRGVGLIMTGTVPASVGKSTKSSVDVVVRDASGKQVAQATRKTTGMIPGGTFEMPLPADQVVAGTPLTVTVTLHAPAAVRIETGTVGGTPAIESITPNAGDGLSMVYVGSSVIYQRLNALPRIRWASQSAVVRDQQQRMRLLSSGNLPDSTVVLSKPGPAASGRPGTVSVDKDGTDAIATTVHAQGAGYLVVADADQVGWSATVDGRPAPLVAADQGLVAVHVPSGKHTVSLRYDLPHAHAAAWASAGVAVLLILIWLGDWWFDRRRRPAPEQV